MVEASKEIKARIESEQNYGAGCFQVTVRIP